MKPGSPSSRCHNLTRAVGGVQGTCEEEVQRIEAFLDTVMRRTQGAAQRAAASEAQWKGQGIPWDAAIFASVRANSLHLATLYMSRQGSLALRQGQSSLLAAKLATKRTAHTIKTLFRRGSGLHAGFC